MKISPQVIRLPTTKRRRWARTIIVLSRYWANGYNAAWTNSKDPGDEHRITHGAQCFIFRVCGPNLDFIPPKTWLFSTYAYFTPDKPPNAPQIALHSVKTPLKFHEWSVSKRQRCTFLSSLYSLVKWPSSFFTNKSLHSVQSHFYTFYGIVSE